MLMKDACILSNNFTNLLSWQRRRRIEDNIKVWPAILKPLFQSNRYKVEREKKTTKHDFLRNCIAVVELVSVWLQRTTGFYK